MGGTSRKVDSRFGASLVYILRLWQKQNDKKKKELNELTEMIDKKLKMSARIIFIILIFLICFMPVTVSIFSLSYS